MRIFPSLNRIATDMWGLPLGGPQRFLRPNSGFRGENPGFGAAAKKPEKAD
jgi:hypothetical protein